MPAAGSHPWAVCHHHPFQNFGAHPVNLGHGEGTGGGEDPIPILNCGLPSLPEQDTIFQVNLLREIHLAGDSGENQSLLAAVR